MYLKSVVFIGFAWECTVFVLYIKNGVFKFQRVDVIGVFEQTTNAINNAKRWAGGCGVVLGGCCLINNECFGYLRYTTTLASARSTGLPAIPRYKKQQNKIRAHSRVHARNTQQH